jgi:hypothetical protein
MTRANEGSLVAIAVRTSDDEYGRECREYDLSANNESGDDLHR